MHPEVYPFTKNLQEKLLFFNLKNFENPQMKSKHEINIEKLYDFSLIICSNCRFHAVVVTNTYILQK